MVILLGGSEQDISMFLDTPRLRDEPRDEEGRDDGLLNRLHLRLHHRILGDAVTPTKGGERTGPEDGGEVAEDGLHRGLQRCGEAIERIASTGVDQHGEVRAGFEDDKDNERTTEQRFESRRVTRYATPDTLRIHLIHLIHLIRLIRLIRRA